MTFGFVFVISAFVGGLCWLFGAAARWSSKGEPEGATSRNDDAAPVGLEIPRMDIEIPDTVPSEWVEAYRADQER